MGPDLSRAPGAQCSQNSTLPVPQVITDGSAPLVFDLIPEYSTEQVVLFWQPLSCFLQWSPSLFVLDDWSYYCAEQFMMAERARRFQDRRAEGLIMSSSDPSARKRIGRGVRNFDKAAWDRVREDAVLAGNFANFSQNLAMKQHFSEHWHQMFG